MSYAEAAARGPKQSAEEARAPMPPQIIPRESTPTSPLIDVDSASVHTVPSDFRSHDIQTSTQVDRLAREAESMEAKAVAEETRLKKEFHEKELAAKEKAKKAAAELEKKAENPVYVGNALVVLALSAGLGFGAYRKYVSGELTWKVVGVWTGLVGLFAAGDYYLSQCLFKKYSEKK